MRTGVSENAETINVLQASESELVLLILGFLAAETSSRTRAIHFNLSELLSFTIERDDERLSNVVSQLVNYGLIASVGSYDSSDFIEECEFKILPAGTLLLAANKFQALASFEKAAPEYLQAITLFFQLMEADQVFQARWSFSGFSTSADSQAEEYAGRIQKVGIQISQGSPASDRVVSRTDNQEAWDQAVDAIDQAIESVRGDNEYGDRDPIDKDQRLAELSAGRRLFDAGQVVVGKVAAVVLDTLNYLSEIGVAVTKIAAAIVAIKMLLGI